jgi:hypothetical protein
MARLMVSYLRLLLFSNLLRATIWRAYNWVDWTQALDPLSGTGGKHLMGQVGFWYAGVYLLHAKMENGWPSLYTGMVGMVLGCQRHLLQLARSS